jgi:carboxylesterase type B
MFMVHGGGFEKGNSARYANVNEIGRKFTSKGIIIVAIQYRLGQFG